MTSRLAGRVADSVGPAVPIVVGMAILSLAMIGVSYAAEEQSYVAMIPAMVVFGIGISLVVTPTRVAAQAAVGEDHQGVVAGVMSTFNRIGAVLGVAAVGALIVALAHGRTIQLLAQQRISPDRNDRAALDSILYHGHRGSAALADDPSRFVAPVRHAASDAFSYAFANGMRFGALIAACAAVLGLLRSTRCSTGGQGRPILPGKAHSRCDIGEQANRDVTLDRLGVPHQLGQLLETFDERLPYLGGDVGIGRCRRRGLEPEQEMRPMLDTLDVELMNAGLHLHRVHDLSGRLDDRHDLPMVPPMAGEEQILLAREQGVDVRLRDVGPFGDCCGRRPVITRVGELVPGGSEDRLTSTIGTRSLTVTGCSGHVKGNSSRNASILREDHLRRLDDGRHPVAVAQREGLG